MGQKRFLLIQVIDPHYHQDVAKQNMIEATSLVQTFGGIVVQKETQHRVSPHPATYIGPGKVEWLKEAIIDQDIDVVVVNAVAKASQLFRIEKTLWSVNPAIKVWDKVDLILAIFEQHAGSVEAKLQIELAKLDHLGPRMYGLGGKELSRQAGGIGTRGKGETNIEFERRVLRDRRQFLLKQLAKAKRQKQHRITRRSEMGLGPVALVGYTSAGKTTLFNRLTGKAKPTSAQLFTTLDTVVGKMKALQGALPVIISDTIGFIQDLPPQLIKAFESTLQESLHAELLLHVVDISDPHYAQSIETVDAILVELKITQPVVLVVNKIDQVSAETQQNFVQQYQERPVITVSAKTGEGLEALKKLIWEKLQS